MEKENNDDLQMRPAADLSRTIAALECFRPGAAFKRSTVAVNPYSGTDRSMEVWFDDSENEYWVDPDTDRLIQFSLKGGHNPKSAVPPKNRKAVAELRRIALEQMEKVRPGFAKRISSLHPLEDNRNREAYFFRFDDFSAPVVVGELPPFIQTAVIADGRVMAFTDTLGA